MENEDEERGDVLALPSMREAGDGRTEGGSGGQTAGEIALEWSGWVAGEAKGGETEGGAGGWTAGEIAAERAETAGEIWKGGPMWTVRGTAPEIDQTQRATAAEQTAQTGRVLQLPMKEDLTLSGLKQVARSGTVDLAPESVGRSGPARAGLEQAGLKGLYRQAVQGLRPAAPALPRELAGETARAQEPGSAASLAVDELDRAVRRDSRRYDGGMSIY